MPPHWTLLFGWKHRGCCSGTVSGAAGIRAVVRLAIRTVAVWSRNAEWADVELARARAAHRTRGALPVAPAEIPVERRRLLGVDRWSADAARPFCQGACAGGVQR